MIPSIEVTISEEFYEEVIEELYPFLEKQNDEVNLFGKELNINHDLYMSASRSGIHKLFVMRHDGFLIGYGGFFLYKHSHQQDEIHANQDIMYLCPEYRKGLLGLKLIRECDRRLKSYGVTMVHQGVPEQVGWGKILEKIGYNKLETIYVRRL